jgi:hypothetical protein
MKPRISGLLGVLAVLVSAATACKKDPTAAGVGAPSAVVADFSAFTLAVGDSASFTARVVDNRLTPLPADITFSSCDATAATVVVDGSYNPVPPTSKRAVIHAVGPNKVCVLASSNGAKPDTVTVTVLPTSFSGAVSNLTPQGGSTLVIKSTAQLKFIPASVSVTFGGGHAGAILGATADTVAVVVPFSDPGKLTIGGIALTYVAGSSVTLPTAASVTQTGDFWGQLDSPYVTAPTLTIPAASGQSTAIITDPLAINNVGHCAEGGETGPCMVFKFVLAASTALTFTANWEGAALAPDVDIYACPSPQAAPADLATCGGAAVGGFGGATAAKPQTFGGTFAAGTYYLVVEIYDNTTTTKNITTTITHN